MNNDVHVVYLALGSNLGDKTTNLQQAIKEIAERVGIVSAISSFYETEPWGFQSSNSFLNNVICVKTELSPVQVLHTTQLIEKKMGRTTKSSGNSYKDRIIDIDLILYDDLILDSKELILPHPQFHKRKFVLEPLCEINPELIHPVLNKTVKQLLEDNEGVS